MERRLRALVPLALLVLTTGATAQVFQDVPERIPQGLDNVFYTENVDLGDIDLDGDWDALLAEGGDQGNQQNHVWINQGGLQGGTIGYFVDETPQRVAVFADTSRDVELADIDNDGDLDAYIANTSSLTNQDNRWWINLGGDQAGTLGFFNDETSTRWVGVGGPGSSVAPSLVLPSGGFIDWSCDCDFGDLDADGDLDLVHSSYGLGFQGDVPTRLFLNDGAGFFSEFNPTGFQLTGAEIQEGDPGIWCEGFQLDGTTDATGQFCDIAATPLDIDLGDIDRDLDLDILHGARDEKPRMFENRLEENGGVLAFRDVTGDVFPAGYSSTTGHYEQELGDLDGDADLDIWGINWQASFPFSFQDATFENDGTGHFGNMLLQGPLGEDGNEVDFLDYDHDGDLDALTSVVFGPSTLHQNTQKEERSPDYSYTALPTSASGLQATAPIGIALDSDAADLDGDGDLDVMLVQAVPYLNTYLENLTDVADTFSPRIYDCEQQADGVVTLAPRRVRARVLDNAPYYVTWYAETVIEVEVNGCPLPPFPMQSSGGEIFQGQIPGNLVGTITWRVRCTDAFGNVGVSVDSTYLGTVPIPFQAPFGAETSGSLGPPQLAALSVPTKNRTLWLATTGAKPGAVFVTGIADDVLAVPYTFPGLLTLNLNGNIVFQAFGTIDSDGCGVVSVQVPSNMPQGYPIPAQSFVLDGVGGVAFASTKGLLMTSQ